MKPSALATASKVPDEPCDRVPAHDPDFRFQDNATSRGTPGASRTVRAPRRAALQAAEFQTTLPCLVTTTRTAPGPYFSWHPDAEVETAYTLNLGCSPER